MIEFYIFLGVVACAIGLFIFVVKISEKKGRADLDLMYKEAEIELRKKFEEIDNAPDVDDPLSKLR